MNNDIYHRRSLAIVLGLLIGASSVAALEIPKLSDEQIANFVSLDKQAGKALRNEQRAEAIELYRKAFAIHEGNAGLWYNTACALALEGQADAAMDALRKASLHGWTDADWPTKDSDLETLQERTDFKEWTASLKGSDEAWPSVDGMTLGKSPAEIAERGEAMDGDVKRVRKVLGSASTSRLKAVIDAWRAASWDGIAASKTGAERHAAEVEALLAIRGAGDVASREVARRAEALGAALAADSPHRLGVAYAAARARYRLDSQDEESEVAAGAIFKAELEQLAARHQTGDVLDDVLIELLARSTDDMERSRELYARIGKLVPDRATLREKMLDEARGAWYQLEGMPEFTATTVDGQKVTRESLAGKVTLVEFWATWCGPCRKELPNLKEVYAKHHPAGFEILGISLDESEDVDSAAFLEWCKDKEVPWRQIYDGKGWDADLAQQFGVDGIPFAILLDRNVQVVAAGYDVRGDELAKRVATLVAAKQAQLEPSAQPVE